MRKITVLMRCPEITTGFEMMLKDKQVKLLKRVSDLSKRCARDSVINPPTIEIILHTPKIKKTKAK